VTPEILAYTVERIASAKVTKLPFPFVYIDAVFEPTFWSQCVLRATAAAPPPQQATLQVTLHFMDPCALQLSR
jgi:hypothetical protein